MEELQSTEVLDKEILEDARKKAFRTLERADDAVKDASLVWQQRLEADLEAMSIRYVAKTKKDCEEIMSRMVQDKRRAHAVKIEGLLKDAVNAYLSALDRRKLLSLLESELSKRLVALQAAGEAISAGDAPEVMIRALTDEEAERILSSAFSENVQGNAFWTMKKPDVAFLSAASFPAIVINTKKVKITASIDAAASALLEDKRIELVSALLGEVPTGGEV